MPQPRLLFIVDKTYVTPMRLIQFLALVALFSATYPYIKRWASLAGRVRLDARAQLADRVLRRLAAQPRRTDHTFRLPWRYRGRHGCGNIGYRNHGVCRMASGMARTGQVKRLGAAVAGVLIASLIAGAVFGEGTSPAAAPPRRRRLSSRRRRYSPECQGGSTEIVTESPLPNVAAALQKRRTVRILAIGDSAGRRQGGYTRQIERILKQVVKGADVVIINRGVSGELAANAALRIKNEVAMTSPDLVIWQVGTDDALAFVPLDEFGRDRAVDHPLAQGAQCRRRARRPAICRPRGAGRELLPRARDAARHRGQRKRDDHPPLRGDAVHRRRAGPAAATAPTNSSAPRPATIAWRNISPARSRSAPSARA